MLKSGEPRTESKCKEQIRLRPTRHVRHELYSFSTSLFRLFDLDPIRACSVVNKVEKLDRKQNSSFRLAPFAAGGGERGKADCCATESGSRC